MKSKIQKENTKSEKNVSELNLQYENDVKA